MRLQDANALGQTSRVQPAFYEEGIKIGAAKKAPVPRRHANGPTSQDGGTESGQKCHLRRGEHGDSTASPFSLWTTEWTLEIPGGQCRDGEDKEWDGKALSSSCYIQCVSVFPEVGCRKTRTLPLFDNDKEYKLTFCPCTYLQEL